MKTKTRFEGFTLIEIMIAMAMLVILGIVLTLFMVQTADSSAMISDESAMQKEIRTAMAILAEDTREAIDYIDGAGGVSSTIGPNGNLLLLSSARMSQNHASEDDNFNGLLDTTEDDNGNGFLDGPNTFAIDSTGTAVPQSLTVYGLYQFSLDIVQLKKYRVYFNEDLAAYPQPLTFTFSTGAGENTMEHPDIHVIIRDNGGTTYEVLIDKETGTIDAVAPTEQPRVLLNFAQSLLVTRTAQTEPLQVFVSGQNTTIRGRTFTCALVTDVLPRNAGSVDLFAFM